MDQLRLPLRADDRTLQRLVIAESNAHAWRALLAWPKWPGGAFALTGPAGAGKSHMAAAWAELAGARPLTIGDGSAATPDAFRAAGGRLWLDGADRAPDDAIVTLAIDLARLEGGALLLVGGPPPALWPAASPDLASRFAALPSARLGEPDLDLLEAVLRRLARARFLELPAPVARYLAQHMERSFAAAHALIGALDGEVRRARAPVSLDAAKRALRGLGAEASEADSAEALA